MPDRRDTGTFLFGLGLGRSSDGSSISSAGTEASSSLILVMWEHGSRQITKKIEIWYFLKPLIFRTKLFFGDFLKIFFRKTENISSKKMFGKSMVSKNVRFQFFLVICRKSLDFMFPHDQNQWAAIPLPPLIYKLYPVNKNTARRSSVLRRLSSGKSVRFWFPRAVQTRRG